MNDFDLSDSGGATAAPPPPPPLTDITVAYALLSYLAVAVVVLGFAVQAWRLLRHLQRTPALAGEGSMSVRLFRAGTDIVLLRTMFFADRWAWIFGAMFHFGLALILLRHLRYFIEPGWIGPLWKLVVLVQPFGLYGGLALPAGLGGWWFRQSMLRQNRIITDKADHAVMAVLIALPLVGYANTLAHTDVVAVKGFVVGLLVFHWQNLPQDPLLLLHLWLVALLLVLLPFSRVLLLLPFGKLLHISPRPGRTARQRRRRLVYWFGPILTAALLAPAAVAVRHAVTEGFPRPGADFASLVADHKTADAGVMIRNHPAFLFSHRTIVLHNGTAAPGDNLERCVTCHAVKDASGEPVGIADPSHFCHGCHNRAAVSIDCFECHTSKPSSGGQAWLDIHTRAALASRGSDGGSIAR